ncbi:glycoside hydrolase family 19 protein [Longimicrobium sp.]|uniref:glycoside hydrolase family 19 protein n=1 Tax=Longimicrobium sp. TaxID=2029185 RepID=UPI002E309C6A|nr:glycoside hydrolase family 19 protein [Longimicrobium sp.]HEX6036878.1 glycoside hydrolase family 19 protein [Longimicrobium sp.]
MKFDRQKFHDAYAAAFGALPGSKQAGLDALLSAAEADTDITDIRWLAYMFATVKHECADTWKPIEEYGKGKGHKYGQPVTVTDPDGKSYSNAYYGRGYVQLTWDYNYRNMGKVLNNRLLYEPGLALDADVAYRIMSYGMRNGSFTGARLSRFISGDTCDYVNARKIINGLDQAQRIAGYAQKLEQVLRASAVAAVPGGVPTPVPSTAPAQPASGQAYTVTAQALNVRGGPGASNPTVAGSPLAQGTAVRAQQSQDGWMYVTVPGTSTAGWVSARYLQPAPAPVPA